MPPATSTGRPITVASKISVRSSSSRRPWAIGPIRYYTRSPTDPTAGTQVAAWCSIPKALYMGPHWPAAPTTQVLPSRLRSESLSHSRRGEDHRLTLINLLVNSITGVRLNVSSSQIAGVISDYTHHPSHCFCNGDLTPTIRGHRTGESVSALSTGMGMTDF